MVALSPLRTQIPSLPFPLMTFLSAAVVPPIVVKDELDSGELKLVAELLGIFEAFYALALRRRFPNSLVETLLSPE